MYCKKCKDKNASFIMIVEDIVFSKDELSDVESYAMCNCLHCDGMIKVRFDIVNIRRIKEDVKTKK